MNSNDMTCAAVNATQYLLLASQANATLQTVQLILSIVSTIIIVGFKIIDWWKKSKKDGKIDKEEIKEGIKIVAEGIKEVQNNIESIKDVEEGDKK